VSVSISTHVLDTGTGKPASGVRVELAQQRSVLAAGETDVDGRISELARDLAPGRFALTFWPPSPFFTKVELEVELGDGHHHIPLLVSPYGCASYRGS
jgi:5-hydroxyisourate hydrolase